MYIDHTSYSKLPFYGQCDDWSAHLGCKALQSFTAMYSNYAVMCCVSICFGQPESSSLFFQLPKAKLGRAGVETRRGTVRNLFFRSANNLRYLEISPDVSSKASKLT